MHIFPALQVIFLSLVYVFNCLVSSFFVALHRMKNCAFVDFKEEAYAARAQSQLHRCVLVDLLVEYLNFRLYQNNP